MLKRILTIGGTILVMVAALIGGALGKQIGRDAVYAATEQPERYTPASPPMPAPAPTLARLDGGALARAIFAMEEDMARHVLGNGPFVVAPGITVRGSIGSNDTLLVMSHVEGVAIPEDLVFGERMAHRSLRQWGCQSDALRGLVDRGAVIFFMPMATGRGLYRGAILKSCAKYGR